MICVLYVLHVFDNLKLLPGSPVPQKMVGLSSHDNQPPAFAATGKEEQVLLLHSAIGAIGAVRCPLGMGGTWLISTGVGVVLRSWGDRLMLLPERLGLFELSWMCLSDLFCSLH